MDETKPNPKKGEKKPGGTYALSTEPPPKNAAEQRWACTSCDRSFPVVFAGPRPEAWRCIECGGDRAEPAPIAAPAGCCDRVVTEPCSKRELLGDDEHASIWKAMQDWQQDVRWRIGAPYTPTPNSGTNQIVKLASEFAYANPPTTRTTLDLCELAIRERIPGDFVECGVAGGAQIAVMASTIRDSKRVVHAFDSFEGIPEAGPHDDETITGLIGRPSGPPQLRSTGHVAHSLQAVRKNMHRLGLPLTRFRFHEGWFQNTVAEAAKGMKIAVLRLDGDLYESTLVCLEAFHGLVPAGGIVIIDDFALTGCRHACHDYFCKHGLTYEIHEIAGGGGPVFWRK